MTCDIKNRQFKKAKINNYIMSINSPDNVCVINNNIIAVQNCLYDNKLDCMVVVGKSYIDKSNLYEMPCQSSLLNCYAVTCLAQNSEVWPISEIEYKCLTLPWNDHGNTCLAVFHFYIVIVK